MDSYQSPFLLSNEKILQMGIDEENVELFRRKHYQDSFGIDSWYHIFGEKETFKTEMIKIEREDAEAISYAYDRYLRSLYRWRGKTNDNIESQIKEKHEDRLRKLEHHLGLVIKEKFEKSGAFIKLNTRSPKDVSWRDSNDEHYRCIVSEEMKKIPKKKLDDEKLVHNEIFISFIKSMNKTMKITSGKEALDLLIKSERVNEDLQKQLRFGVHFSSQIIIREWIEEVVQNPQYEFRCFVHEKSLNAVTQYFCDVVFEDLIEQNRRKEVEMAIVNYFNSTVKPKILHPSFVIDLFVSPKTNKVYIIELNPFHIGAGAGLFSWKNDRNLFMNGPLQFRYQTTYPNSSTYENLLTIQWEKYLIATHHFFQIPGHDSLKSLVKKDSENIFMKNIHMIIISIIISCVSLYWSFSLTQNT